MKLKGESKNRLRKISTDGVLLNILIWNMHGVLTGKNKQIKGEIKRHCYKAERRPKGWKVHDMNKRTNGPQFLKNDGK